MLSAHNQNAGLLSTDDLCGDDLCGASPLVLSKLHFTIHLAPDTRVAPKDFAAVVTERALQKEDETENQSFCR